MTDLCEQLGAFADGALNPESAERVRDHLSTCTQCQQALHEILQLQVVEQRVAPSIPRGSANRASLARRRRVRWTVAGVSALAAAAAVALYIWTKRATVDLAPVDLTASASERMVETRLAHRSVSSHRRYNPVAGVAPAGNDGNLLRKLATLEGAADWQGLGAAYLWLGQPALAKVYLDRLNSKSLDVESERAAMSVLQGDYPAALTRLAEILSRAPAHPQALWNRALVEQHLQLGLAAAQDFGALAAQNESGWSTEASARGERLRVDAMARHAAWLRMSATGAALRLSHTEVPPELLTQFPDELRLHLYEAVRAAPSAERVRELEPLAQHLDRHFGDGQLTNYVNRTAGSFPADRRLWAESYRQIIDQRVQLSSAQIEETLKTFRSGQAADILLGALVHTDRAAQSPAEYVALAKATQDPWFELLAVQQQAVHDAKRGALLDAEHYLAPAARGCRAGPYRYRCAYLNFKLGDIYKELNRTVEAAEAGRAALTLAMQCNAWELETSILALLGDVAFFDHNYALTRAYFREIAGRESLGTPDCRFARFMRDRLAMVDLFNLRYEDARRDLAEAAGCGQSLGKIGLFALVDLARLGPPSELQSARARVSAWRAELPPSRDRSWWADFLEGRLQIGSNRQEGEQLLRSAIAGAERENRWDEEARKVRAYSYQTLISDAARRGDSVSALMLLAEELEVPQPAKCAVGLAQDGEQLVAMIRGADGATSTNLERVQYAQWMTRQAQLPESAVAPLLSCPEVEVLAEAPFQGQGRLLPAQLAWGYRIGALKSRPVHENGRSLIVSEVEPPIGLQLPPLSAWTSVPPELPATMFLKGPAATPSQVVAAMGDANEIVLHAHGLVKPGVSDVSFLALSADNQGQYALTAPQIQQLSLRGAPIVILSACRAATPAPMLYAPRSLPKAFVEAGARTVLAAAGDIPSGDASVFFASIRQRIRQGQAPSSALRDERLAWLSKPNQAWVLDVLLFQ